MLDAEEQTTSAGLDGNTSAPEQQSTSRERSAIDDYEPVPYNYSFFHLIFTLATLYVAMLLTAWGKDNDEASEISKTAQRSLKRCSFVGVSWTSVWVKMGSQIFTALLYIWVLVAPILFPDRDFS